MRQVGRPITRFAMRRSPARLIVMRHSLALAAALLTVMLFAVESRGRATGTSVVKASGFIVANGAASDTRIDLELFHPAGAVDMRRALREARFGAIDQQEVGDEALTFSARLTSIKAADSAAATDVAECTWTDSTRARAECQIHGDGEEDTSLSLTVIRNPQRTRDVGIWLSRATPGAASRTLDARVNVTW